MTRKNTSAPATSAPATSAPADPFASVPAPSAPLADNGPAMTEGQRFGMPEHSPAPVTLAPVRRPIQRDAAGNIIWSDSAPAASSVPVTAPASPVQTPAPVKVGALPNETRLQWMGGGHVQKGKSGGYNNWMARQPGPFTVQQAIDAGIPGHHIRYVTGQGWARRV